MKLLLDFLPIDPDYSVAEVAMPGSLSGKTLAEANLRTAIGVHVMGIKDVLTGKFEMFPDGRRKLLDAGRHRGRRRGRRRSSRRRRHRRLAPHLAATRGRSGECHRVKGSQCILSCGH
jgi:hypothetical protein